MSYALIGNIDLTKHKTIKIHIWLLVKSTFYCNGLPETMAGTSNYIFNFMWDVITYRLPNFNTIAVKIYINRRQQQYSTAKTIHPQIVTD